jgi:hypothetical protein
MRTKNATIAVLVFITFALAYRVFDLGVTIGYLEVSVTDARMYAETLKEFQRTSCKDIAEISPAHSPFEKNGLIYINSIGFECVEVVGQSGKKFVHSDK